MNNWTLIIAIGINGLCGGPHYTQTISFKNQQQCEAAANKFPRNYLCDQIFCVEGGETKINIEDKK